MKWNDHSKLEGSHAFLGASKYSWLNYDDEKLVTSFRNQQAIKTGTELHSLAAECIRLNQRVYDCQKTFNMYVNDAIGFKMIPEQVLQYSDHCYGTADSISFKRKLLRIHDLKTGQTPANMKQLYIYAALFCLEYKQKPGNIGMELRIYQFDDIFVEKPEADIIVPIMDKIKRFSLILDQLTEEE